MKTRDEYVAGLKTRLDDWNKDMARWEAQSKAARDDMAKRYAKELEGVRARQEQAAYQMKLLQGASTSAWSDFVQGADEAWERLHHAMTDARKHFEKA
ncbi:hypothetical protein [Usitatibacter palustris]|uniref:Coiled coil domain-containing protein n=1 Tax=Usitatibacter palustris TaxID=2732487 RepID=A0A6M4H3M3_9PROT|nr:hypothetical protein [Usitatibacter palustris]QJR14179.1 hypothetical protein DSM104440_00972 [Usitatibacter palustris]